MGEIERQTQIREVTITPEEIRALEIVMKDERGPVMIKCLFQALLNDGFLTFSRVAMDFVNEFFADDQELGKAFIRVLFNKDLTSKGKEGGG
jgi:hypothetical protein